jgi:hypothetical protein
MKNSYLRMLSVPLLMAPIVACLRSSAQSYVSPVVVDLPTGWHDHKPRDKKMFQLAQYPELDAWFELRGQPSADFTGLMAWARLVKEHAAKQPKLAIRSMTDLKERTNAGRATVEYEVTGDIGGVNLHYRVIMLRVGDWFASLCCWTTPSHWEEAQPKFDELVGRVRSNKQSS